MLQKIYLTISLIVSFTLCIPVCAQEKDAQQLPNDPRVKTGSLANGLTYYIFKNEAVKGHADFAIVQKTGTSIEAPNQKGMCKMLELLSTKGTRNFTDSTIVKYLNSIGVDSKSIVFETEADNIKYSIKNIPIGKQNTMDSALLIMYNWLASINIDEEDIEQSVPMLKNSLIDEWDAQRRIDDKLVKELYPKSPYAKSITAEQINQMEGFSTKELRNFYYNWFRPDLQAVFVVGDVNLDKVETQIKSIFSTIPKPLKSEKRNYYKPKIFDDTKVVITKDPEYNKTTIAIHFLKEPLLKKYKLTSVPYIEEYFDHAITTLLLNRIQEGIVEQNLPISNVKIEKGKFMDMTNLETFSVSFETLPGSVYSAISFLSGEINIMARYGFNNQEYGNARNMYYRELEFLYDNRFSQPNSVFMDRVVNHYLNNYSLASIEMHFEIMKEIIYNTRSQQLNNYASALLGQKEGVVISCSMPDVKGLEDLSVERIKNSFINSLSKSTAGENLNKIVEWPKFETTNKVAHILQQSQDPATGSHIFILSNGIRVMLKQTQGSLDTVSFKGISKGGLSVARENYGRDINCYISDIANLSNIGGLSRSNWEKLFVYNNMQLNAKITDNTEELYGYTIKENLEKFFHAINLNFTTRKSDYNSFDIYKKGKSYEALYRKLSPEKVFEDSVRFYNSSNKLFTATMSKEYVDNMDYNKIHNTIVERFSNPADFTFVFAGNVDVELFKEYIIKYLGSLNTSDNTEDWFVKPIYPAKGKIERRFLHQMVIPRTFVNITLSSGMPYNLENLIMCRMLKEYLSGLYTNGTIKELSPVSYIDASVKYYPEEILMCNSTFETDSAGVNTILNTLNSKLQDIVYNGMNINEFGALVNTIQTKREEEIKRNSYWVEVLSGRKITGKDLHTNYESTLKTITPDKFKSFVEQIYRRGNMITVVMEGTTEDVNTQNLFRENQFIRDFFDL